MQIFQHSSFGLYKVSHSNNSEKSPMTMILYETKCMYVWQCSNIYLWWYGAASEILLLWLRLSFASTENNDLYMKGYVGDLLLCSVFQIIPNHITFS